MFCLPQQDSVGAAPADDNVIATATATGGGNANSNSHVNPESAGKDQTNNEDCDVVAPKWDKEKFVGICSGWENNDRECEFTPFEEYVESTEPPILFGEDDNEDTPNGPKWVKEKFIAVCSGGGNEDYECEFFPFHEYVERTDSPIGNNNQKDTPTETIEKHQWINTRVVTICSGWENEEKKCESFPLDKYLATHSN